MKASKGFTRRNDIIRLFLKSSFWLEEGTGGEQGGYTKELEGHYYILGKNCFFGQLSGSGIGTMCNQKLFTWFSHVLVLGWEVKDDPHISVIT